MNHRRVWRDGLLNWDTEFVCIVVLLAVGMPQVVTSILGREQRDLRKLDDFEELQNELSLVDACASAHDFEKLTSAVNDQLELVEVAPDTWVYVTRCRHGGKKCLGVSDTIYSVCRPKKSWLQVYGRTKNGPWQPHWVAVDTSCACAVEKQQNGYVKSSDKLGLYPLYIL